MNIAERFVPQDGHIQIQQGGRRVDIRVGEDKTPYFLEINPLPGLSPVYGDLVIMARGMGWDYARLVKVFFIKP
jgi:D-alanine-D-alanine ligase-like ATP-grasp enzyme